MLPLQINPQRVLVIFDDLDLPLGKVRLRAKGSHGGHNGMRSIMQHMKGAEDIPRLKIGIGRPEGRMPVAAFVLQVGAYNTNHLIMYLLYLCLVSGHMTSDSRPVMHAWQLNCMPASSRRRDGGRCTRLHRASCWKVSQFYLHARMLMCAHVNIYMYVTSQVCLKSVMQSCHCMHVRCCVSCEQC